MTLTWSMKFCKLTNHFALCFVKTKTSEKAKLLHI